MSFYQRNKFLVWVLVLGFLFRLLILAFNPISPFPDEITYDKLSWQLAQSWKGGEAFDVVKGLSHIHIGYYYLVGSVYYLFGHNVLLIKLLNIFLGLAGAWLLYLLARELFQRRTAKIAFLLAAFWPSLAFWSTRNLKDTLVIFLLVAVASLFLKLTKRFKLSFLAFFLLLCFCLLTLRAYTLFLLLGSLILGKIVAGFSRFSKKDWALIGIIVCLLVGVFFFLKYLPGLEWNYFAKINLQTLQDVRASTLIGGSSFLKGADVSTWGGVFKLLPPATLYSLFAPFPWQGGSGLFRIAVPETILWYILFILALAGLVLCWKKRLKNCLGIVLFMAFMTLTLAIFQGNIGTLFRQREQVWIFAFLLSGLGAEYLLLSKSHFLKRAFDLVLSLICIVLLSPFFLIVVAVILKEDGRPVFYRSQRVGLLGKKFEMLKFRTMLVDRSHIPEFEYTPENDPRVTKVGKFLRRFSLDELPQIINILKGEMSFVGPRPTHPFRMVGASEVQKRRTEVKPGLTGWQQINGRNTRPWPEMMELDRWYVENRSFLLDLKIILKTFKVMLNGKGRNASQAIMADAAEDFLSYIKASEEGEEAS